MFDIKLFERSVRSAEVTDFARQLATMVGAHLPLVRCLDILVQQQSNARFKNVINDVKQSVSQGDSLSNSLGKHSKIFNRLFVNIIYVGEVSGNLAELLQQLANYLEKMSELKRKLLTAFSYPTVIVFVAIGAISFLLFGILPTFSEMFEEFGANMPVATRLLLDGSSFVKDNIFFIMLGLTVCIFIIRFLGKTRKGELFFHKVQIKAPVLGTVIRKIIIARFSRTLGILLSSGISLLEALEITAVSTNNIPYRNLIVQMKQLTAKGQSIEKSIGDSKLFPPLVIQMIAVGEETAELSAMLGKTAAFYESEVDAAIETLTSIIEPVIIVVLGVVLGGTIIAIYMQIFDLMNVVH
ncbi:MAG: type II secretion system F family protein [Deferribacteres bacterium]|nr:type II secretion system F family protein [candidate division KSB1 bacterium]MCB9503114.1 type II secretion system F family protein [Deferribacteres bacterium]